MFVTQFSTRNENKRYVCMCCYGKNITNVSLYRACLYNCDFHESVDVCLWSS